MKRRPFSEGSNIVDSQIPDGFTPPEPASLLGVPSPPAVTERLTDTEREQINWQVRNTASWARVDASEAQLVHMEQSVGRTVESIVATRVRAAQAQAWDEGLSVGTGMARIYGHTDHWPDVEPANPYSEPGDEFQNPED